MLVDGRIALVTGASRGIGRAVALALAANGADVAVNYAGSTQAAETVAEEIRAMGRKALVVQADVSDAAAVQQMIADVTKEFGRIDILVNNAGITRDGLLMRMKDEDWDAVLKTNLTGVYYCTKAVVKAMMKQRYGRIINMSSVVGVTGNAGQANYAAAKAGVIGFTKATAKELASRSITVNAVAPGFIESDMTAGLPDKAKTDMAASIPLGKIGQPADVAQAVVFLASDWAGYITGQTLHVDGGMVM